MYKVSVIVPVYNVEAYLTETLESLVSQTIFSDIEIILIDDGSTDGGLAICQRYAQKYINIKVFSQHNSGVSAARNKGLDEATSPYVMFVDSDDTILSDMCESLLAYISSESVDLAITDFSFVTKTREHKKHGSIVKKLFSNDEILKAFFKGNLIENTLCDKIFCREILNELRLKEGYAIGEDMFFVFEYLLRCKSVYINTETSHYRYMIRKDSAMTSVFSKKYLDAVNLSQQMETMVSKTLLPYAEGHTIHEITKLLAQLLVKNARYQEEEIYQGYLSTVKRYSLLSAYRYLDKKQFIAVLLLKINPAIYLFVWEKMRGY